MAPEVVHVLDWFPGLLGGIVVEANDISSRNPTRRRARLLFRTL